MSGNRYLLDSNVIIDVFRVNATTAQFYGKIKAQLKQGNPIPENDLWIAAIASEHTMVLLTRDAHFEHVESITIEKL